MSFDTTAARLRLARLWALGACVGVEREAQQVYLDEIVSDRGALTHGLQVLRDELQFATYDGHSFEDGPFPIQELAYETPTAHKATLEISAVSEADLATPTA